MNDRYVVTFHSGRSMRLYAYDEDEAAKLAREKVRAQGEDWGGVAFVEKVGSRGKFVGSQYRYARENPSTQQWLMIGLGAIVVGGIGYMVYTSYQNTSWPPNASVQQGVLDQIFAANSAMGGQAPTAAQSAALASSIQQLPAMYVASLPAGASPTIAGYQAWASANVMNYVAQGGAPGGYVSTLQATASS